MSWLMLAAAISAFSGVVGVKLQGPLVLNPNQTVYYTEAQLSAYYPPLATISMGSVPTDIFSSSSNLGNLTVAEPPVVS